MASLHCLYVKVLTDVTDLREKNKLPDCNNYFSLQNVCQFATGAVKMILTNNTYVVFQMYFPFFQILHHVITFIRHWIHPVWNMYIFTFCIFNTTFRKLCGSRNFHPFLAEIFAQVKCAAGRRYIVFLVAWSLKRHIRPGRLLTFTYKVSSICPELIEDFFFYSNLISC